MSKIFVGVDLNDLYEEKKMHTIDLFVSFYVRIKKDKLC